MTNASGVMGRSKAIKSYLSRLLSMRMKLPLSSTLPNLAGLFLAVSGSIILAWVGWLTWYDVTTWDKDIALVFFGSRTGEAISLGVGMKVIHYFLIGLALLLPGLVTPLRRRSKPIKLYLNRLLRPQPEKKEKGPSECLHNFGYLAGRLKNTSIPQECLICPKILECIAVETY